jgi:hypothetical protein
MNSVMLFPPSRARQGVDTNERTSRAPRVAHKTVPPIRNAHDLALVQIAQASEKITFLSGLNEMKEPPSKSRAQQYL